ncbi:UNVERIFIED_ORG: hypothetical protein ABIB52_002553 [Arthrobacter sp. UYCu721]
MGNPKGRLELTWTGKDMALIPSTEGLATSSGRSVSSFRITSGAKHPLPGLRP